MSSVTFSTSVGGDGSTVTDDDNATTGLGNGGALIRLVPMMQQVVNVASHVVSVAGGTGDDAAAAAASYDSFDDRYLGAKASDPTIDNDGNTLLVGALYWNSSSGVMKVWTGSAWVNPNPAAGYLALSGGTMTGAITFAAGQVFLKWAIKTTTYTAVAGDALLANTTSGAFTITLPASPATNDYVAVADYAGTFATNNLTINSNSLKIMGTVQTLVLNVNYRNVTLVYSGATQGWVIVL